MYPDCGFGGGQDNCTAAFHSPAPHKAQPDPQDAAGTFFFFTTPEVVSYIGYTKVTLRSTDAPLFYTRGRELCHTHTFKNMQWPGSGSTRL